MQPRESLELARDTYIRLCNHLFPHSNLDRIVLFVGTFNPRANWMIIRYAVI